MSRPRQGRVFQPDPGRGRPWSFRVDIGRPGGRRRQVQRGGFPTKTAATEALHELLGDDEPIGTAGRETLGRYLARWLDGLVAQGRKPSTVDGYRRKVETHVVPDLGSVRLVDLTPVDLDELYATLLTRPRRGRRSGSLSPTTVIGVHRVLSSALADAEDAGLIRRNPAAKAHPPSVAQVEQVSPTVWTPEETRAFLAHVDGTDYGPMFRTMALTGMRRAEACGLRWADVDLEVGVVTISTTVTTAGQEAVEVAPKSKRARRTIDLDPVTVATLKRWRVEQSRCRLMMGAGWPDHDRVFTYRDGRPFHPDVVSKSFRRLADQTDLPRIRLHDLRVGHGSLLLDQGASLREIADRLGHADPAFTLRTYTRAVSGRQAEVAARAASAIDG